MLSVFFGCVGKKTSLPVKQHSTHSHPALLDQSYAGDSIHVPEALEFLSQIQTGPIARNKSCQSSHRYFAPAKNWLFPPIVKNALILLDHPAQREVFDNMFSGSNPELAPEVRVAMQQLELFDKRTKVIGGV
jgi:hypothetical protein